MLRTPVFKRLLRRIIGIESGIETSADAFKVVTGSHCVAHLRTLYVFMPSKEKNGPTWRQRAQNQTPCHANVGLASSKRGEPSMP